MLISDSGFRYVPFTLYSVTIVMFSSKEAICLTIPEIFA